MGLLSKSKKVQQDVHDLVGHVLDDRLRVIRLAYISPRQWLYEAEPPSVGKTRCAIKVLGDPSGREPGSFYRFKVVCDRIKASQSLRIEKVLECGTLHDLTPYVVTTWEAHISLYEYLRRQKKHLSWEVTKPLLIEITEGLYELHKAGVTHGDLRAQHVLLRSPPHDAVLIDYGVSAAFGSPPAPGMDKSLAYWAPERLTFAAATPATDLYSLGVLMYLCLTGQLPFEPKFEKLLKEQNYSHLDPQSALSEYHRTTIVPPLSTDAPPRIVQLIEMLMNKEPAKRPSDVEEVLEILRAPTIHSKGSPTPISSTEQDRLVAKEIHGQEHTIKEGAIALSTQIDQKATWQLIFTSVMAVILGTVLSHYLF
jgi:serine/threonine protein kinase